MPASDADSDATVPLIRHVTVTLETSHQTSHYRRGRLNTEHLTTTSNAFLASYLLLYVM